MSADFDVLKMIYDKNIDFCLSGLSGESADIVRARIDEIPSEFYEPRFGLEGDKGDRISLIEFSMQTAGLSPERRNGLLMRYSIDPYDFKKLQNIVDSINVARDYDLMEKSRRESENGGRGETAYADRRYCFG